MSTASNRRAFLKQAGVAAGVAAVGSAWSLPALAGRPGAGSLTAVPAPAAAVPESAAKLIRLSFNENPFGPSKLATEAIQRELGQVNRYGDDSAAEALVKQIAAYERLPAAQVIPGEVLDVLGLHLGTEGGPGGEFIYSSPGYLALVDATSHVGGVSVAVPLDSHQRNDLAAIAAKVTSKTRAVYLVNPHNPSGTVSDDAAFKAFLRDVSKRTLVIVDEAYLEYTADFATRSAVDLVREGANVAVFRTLAKIHGLAGLPFGYLLAPAALITALRKQGAGGGEGLGRLTIVAAGAALKDNDLIEHSRAVIAAERAKWLALLAELKLPHSPSEANFVFFDTGKPQAAIGAFFKEHGVDIGRAFPPLDTWARITIGLPAENARAQAVLRQYVGSRS
jgi:histidinol-phosphate aminotransferase